MDKLITILGFTGSGKSELAVQLAKQCNGEIVSADSRQLYMEMAIGTGKVNGEWQDNEFIFQDISHHLLDFLTPDKAYSVGEYKEAAEIEINKIIKSGRSPILSGGTAQYIYAVIDNWQIPRVAPNEPLRKDYENKLKVKKITLDDLWNELIKQDPEAADFVQPNNPRRIIRALEVIKATGKKFSEIRKKRPPLYDSLVIGVTYEREELYEKVDQRIDQMMQEGLEKEATALLIKYGIEAPGLQTIGYQEFIPYLKKETTLAEVIQKIKFNTHAYVRYQNSWFNKDERIKWVKDYSEVDKLIRQFFL